MGSRPRIPDSPAPSAGSPAAEGGAWARASGAERGRGEKATRIDGSRLRSERSAVRLHGSLGHPCFVVHRGPDAGRVLHLQEGENGLGRGLDNDIVLTDVAVSRMHLTLVVDDGAVTLRDRGSGNGTRVNGELTTEADLDDGDQVEVGQTVLVLRIPGVPTSRPGADAGPTWPTPVASTLPPPSALDAPPLDVPVGYGAPPGPRRIVLPQETSDGVVVPRSFLVAIACGVLILVVLLTVAVTLLVLGGPGAGSSRPPGTGVETPLARAREAFAARRWDDAEQAYAEARAAGSSSTEVEARLRQLGRLDRDRARLAEARRLLEAEELEDALDVAREVAQGSLLHAEAVRLADDLRGRLVAAATGAGRAALAAGEREEAARQLERARAWDAEAPAVAALEAALATPPAPPGATASEETASAETASPETAAAEAPPRRRPRRRPADPGPIHAAYEAGDFVVAAERARRAARGPDRAAMGTLASRIDRFAADFGRLERAGFPAVLRVPMEAAHRLDRQILPPRGSVHGARLGRAIASAYVDEARQQQPVSIERSCRAVRHALAFDRLAPGVAELLGDCEQEAHTRMARARRASLPEAEGLYGSAIALLPPGHPVAGQARLDRQAMRRRSSVDGDR